MKELVTWEKGVIFVSFKILILLKLVSLVFCKCIIYYYLFFLALHKRSCEELFLSGYKQTGTYMIDIDRNGPLPPAHVICLMSQDDGTIQTIIQHNMRRQMVYQNKISLSTITF